MGPFAIPPPNANVVPTGHVARAVPPLTVLIVRDTSLGAGPGPQYRDRGERSMPTEFEAGRHAPEVGRDPFEPGDEDDGMRG